ncbi:MAG: pitrilysin family protein [Flavobacteriales bacterium]|nr:pitrilysin family protein [Flavobacteriales bacterium]
MKKSFLYITLFASLFLAACSALQPVDRSKVPAAGPAPIIRIGEYQTFQLENGLKVIVVENHKLPRVSYQISLDVVPGLEGSKAGFVSMAGQLLKNGTATRSKAQIDESVDFIGANLGSSSRGVSGSCLKKHSSTLLEVMSDVLLNPSFPDDEIEKLRKQTLSGLASSQTDPNTISSRISDLSKYGSSHPYGEFETESSVKTITRDDLVRYYNTYFKPNVSYLVIVGDITPEEAKTQAEKYFGGWKRGNVSENKFKMPTIPAGNEVVFVPLPGAVQSVIDITYAIDLKPGTQEAITASVLNNILGGNSFQSRLIQNLREDKAYTYGAYSSISPDETVGSFSAGASVRNEVTDSAITQFLYEMDRLTKELIHDSTLTVVKNIMTGNFARSLESPQTVANFALNIEKYQLPKDYYETYLQKLNAVTADDLMKVAQKFIKPSNAYITVVGNKDVVGKLGRFAASGKVNLYNSDGSVFSDLKPVPDGVTANTVLGNYVEALGGAAKLSSIHSFEQEGNMAMGPMVLPVNIKAKEGGKFRMSVSMNGSPVMTTVCDGNKAKMESMGQASYPEGQELTQLRMQTDIKAELHYQDYGITPTLKGIGNIDGKEYYVVELLDSEGEVMSTDYFDISTSLRYKTVVVESADGNTSVNESVIHEYLVFDGIKMPSKVTINNGAMEMNTTKVIWNPKFEDKDFIVE